MKETSAKYSEVAILPAEALCADDKLNGNEYITSDGVKVLLSYTHTTKLEDVIDKECKELYSMSYEKVLHIWKQRLGSIRGVWHKVNMKKV